MGVGPQVHRRAHELGAVVAVDALGHAPLEPQPLECRGHVLSGQRLAGVDGQALARIQIEHRQRPEPAPVRTLVGHEVHAPDVIARGGGTPLLPVHRCDVPPRPLPAQGEPFFRVHAVEALFTHRPAFPEQQHAQTAIAEAHPRLRQLAHPLPQRGQRILPTAVVHRGPGRPQQPARPPRAHTVSARHVPHRLALRHGLQNFF